MGEALLRLDDEVLQGLAREASLAETSESALANTVIHAFLEAQDARRRLLAERRAEADKGEFISEEAMLDWMDRLDQDPNATPPEPDTFLPPRA